jgi:VIT1/CCC1 family predicted Fe2+/Mn2+ transporter
MKITAIVSLLCWVLFVLLPLFYLLGGREHGIGIVPLIVAGLFWMITGTVFSLIGANVERKIE